MQVTSLKFAVLASFFALILGGCATQPVEKKAEKPVVSAAPVYQLQSQPITTEACCYHPSEIVKYQNKPVADCAKPVEVIRYKNTCHDCAYPVIIRSDNLCNNKK